VVDFYTRVLGFEGLRVNEKEDFLRFGATTTVRSADADVPDELKEARATLLQQIAMEVGEPRCA